MEDAVGPIEPAIVGLPVFDDDHEHFFGDFWHDIAVTLAACAIGVAAHVPLDNVADMVIA